KPDAAQNRSKPRRGADGALGARVPAKCLRRRAARAQGDEQTRSAAPREDAEDVNELAVEHAVLGSFDAVRAAPQDIAHPTEVALERPRNRIRVRAHDEPLLRQTQTSAAISAAISSAGRAPATTLTPCASASERSNCAWRVS